MINEMMLCEELFHTPTGVAFADFITDGHRETWPIRSKSFRNWVRRCYYQATGAAAGAAMIGSALNLLEARAQFDAAERAVNIRVAEHDGRLYLDLADEHWRADAIGPDGWRVLGCPPVRFRRSPGMCSRVARLIVPIVPTPSPTRSPLPRTCSGRRSHSPQYTYHPLLELGCDIGNRAAKRDSAAARWALANHATLAHVIDKGWKTGAQGDLSPHVAEVSTNKKQTTRSAWPRGVL